VEKVEILACGPKAALSHRSAAALWGFGKETACGPVDVTVRARFESRRTGLRVRSRPQLPAGDVLVKDGIPVTSPARTLLDEAADLLPPLDPFAVYAQGEKALAMKLAALTPTELRAIIVNYRLADSAAYDFDTMSTAELAVWIVGAVKARLAA